MPKRASRLITAEPLQPIAAHGEKLILIDQQPLRSARAESRCNHFKLIENAVVVGIDQAPDGVAIADQKASLTIEGECITASRQFAGRRAIDSEPGTQLEPVIQPYRGGGSPRRRHTATNR
jgi:hypothetical protein